MRILIGESGADSEIEIAVFVSEEIAEWSKSWRSS